MIYENPIVNEECDEFEVNNWIISRFIVDVLVPIVGTHPFPLSEQVLLVATICRFRPDHVFEWGTNIGKSARIFFEISKHFQIPFQIHSIDLPDDVPHVEHPGDQRGILVKGLSGVNLYLGDGLDTSINIIHEIGSICKPVFFLDGDHSYSSVYCEISTISQLVHNPVIIVHDTFFQSPKSNYNVGPYEAIKKFLSEKNSQYNVISTNTGLPGMTMLYKKRE